MSLSLSEYISFPPFWSVLEWEILPLPLREEEEMVPTPRTSRRLPLLSLWLHPLPHSVRYCDGEPIIRHTSPDFTSDTSVPIPFSFVHIGEDNQTTCPSSYPVMLTSPLSNTSLFHMYMSSSWIRLDLNVPDRIFPYPLGNSNARRTCPVCGPAPL